MPTNDQVLSIVRAGGSVIISARSFTYEQLLSLVQAAKGRGSHVTIRDTTNLTAERMLQLAQAGSGVVAFDYVSK